MNKHFEYMTAYAVFIVRVYIKMGVFLNSSVTTLSNCTLYIEYTYIVREYTIYLHRAYKAGRRASRRSRGVV
jgi:hypothetical protein